MKARGDVKFLKGLPLFSVCSDSDIAAILEFSTPQDAIARQHLFSQGEPCAAFYVLCDGAIKLVSQPEEDQCKVMDLVGPGTLVGEEALFFDCGYLLTAIAAADSELLAIKAAPFVDYLRSHSVLSQSMMRHLTRRLCIVIRRLESYAAHTAEQRVAAYLLAQMNGNGAGSQINSFHSRRDLASFLAITPETLSRTISEFRRRKWITMDRRKIMVRDPDRLAQVVE